MAILAAMQSAALRVTGDRPTVFFGSTRKTEQELADLANEVAADIAKSHDWQALTSVRTMNGDGTTVLFNLPGDYDRMLVNTDIQDTTSWAWGYRHITDMNDFLYWQARDFQPSPGGWTIYGNAMHFVPAPPDGQNAVFPYISRFYARDSGTQALKGAFDADTDTFLLPERLLTLGLVWRWRENKGLPFDGDQEAFMKAISEYAAKDRGSSVYRRRPRMTFPGTALAWPWELG